MLVAADNSISPPRRRHGRSDMRRQHRSRARRWSISLRSPSADQIAPSPRIQTHRRHILRDDRSRAHRPPRLSSTSEPRAGLINSAPRRIRPMAAASINPVVLSVSGRPSTTIFRLSFSTSSNAISLDTGACADRPGVDMRRCGSRSREPCGDGPADRADSDDPDRRARRCRSRKGSAASRAKPEARIPHRRAGYAARARS